MDSGASVHMSSSDGMLLQRLSISTSSILVGNGSSISSDGITLIFAWTFPPKRKSDVHQQLIDFITYARTQFSVLVIFLQADNNTELVNSSTSAFLAAHGIMLRLSCPYTYPHNGKAEHYSYTQQYSVHPASSRIHVPTILCRGPIHHLLTSEPAPILLDHPWVPYTHGFPTHVSMAHHHSMTTFRSLDRYATLTFRPHLRTSLLPPPSHGVCLRRVSLCSQSLSVPQPMSSTYHTLSSCRLQSVLLPLCSLLNRRFLP